MLDYQYEKNTYSDSQFLKDYMEQQPDNSLSATLTTDGGSRDAKHRFRWLRAGTALIIVSVIQESTSVSYSKSCDADSISYETAEVSENRRIQETGPFP